MAKISSSKTASFKLHAPNAKKVAVAGSFNNWNIKDLNAKKDTKGYWSAKVNLKPGRYEYKFFVDGTWVNDPHCSAGCITNSFGSQNCVLEIK